MKLGQLPATADYKLQELQTENQNMAYATLSNIKHRRSAGTSLQYHCHCSLITNNNTQHLLAWFISPLIDSI